VRTTF